jgi:spore maturation protein CgeB
MIGSQLIYPCTTNIIFKYLFKPVNCVAYSTGITFSDESGFFAPYPISQGKQLDDQTLINNNKRSTLRSYCFLLAKDVYLKSGGMDERFQLYGEDIDLGLKLLTLGYTNYYNATSVLVSYPTITIKKILDRTSRKKQSDINRLQKKWFHTLKKSYWSEKLQHSPSLFSETPLTIAMAVTDHGDNVTAGDYFTAQELATTLASYGWNIHYLSRKKGEWYHIPETTDALLILLDAYDLNKLPKRKKRLITIAWARNWFDLWCQNPCFKRYNIVLASSQTACDYIQQHSQQIPFLLPIATNPAQFSQPPFYTKHPPEFYQSDLCFTGSYWDYPRDIMHFLSTNIISKYRFSIYGANWEKVDKFKAYDKGFIHYADIPCVYHNTKIVIDDANHVTKPYGSVNSRVFDAIISGALVITNGVQGSKELFQGELPYYETQDELDQLIDFYLQNENKRQDKVKVLQHMVAAQHTYVHRATTFRQLLENYTLSTSIAIKVPSPSWEDAYSWGDFHMAIALKAALESYHYHVILQMLPEWNNKEGKECDIALVLRGLSRYTIQSHQLNIMWNISHPDKVTLKEYEEYDIVYIASACWAKKISKQISTPVETMLQCTDPALFHPPSAAEKQTYQQALLFVGNSRNVYRKIIQDVLPTSYDLAIYGKNWNTLVPEQYIKGEYIPNNELYRHYGSACILLNDHWGDMRTKGFISNRIFDGLASGAFILSDNIEGMGELEPFVQKYNTDKELAQLIDYYLSQPALRQQTAQQGMQFIIDHHTFAHRAEQFHLYIQHRLNAITHQVSS